MRIEAVEIRNFRKLSSVRLDFSEETTLLVGANNSGKTSALIALRSFLKDGIRAFGKNDLTLSRWQDVNAIGSTWVSDNQADSSSEGSWDRFLPSLDVWLSVEDGEVHRVSALLPTLEWAGGRVGVRVSLEPENEEELELSFREAWSVRESLKAQWNESHISPEQVPAATPTGQLVLWPESLIDFLSRDFQRHLKLRYYVLDPALFKKPEADVAQVQDLSPNARPLDSNPLEHLVRIDEINAQRGLGDLTTSGGNDASGHISDTARLSRQLGDYYTNHLDPSASPELADLDALETIAIAQKGFDDRLEDAFKVAFEEMAALSYPGVADPRIRVASKLSAVDSLKHESAVSFALDIAGVPETRDMHLPEGQNGLGYQNLISMVFRLMSYRDRWMRTGKARAIRSSRVIEPIHLVLIEEPEAHLHVQVQQVFAKKAYDVLRRHPDLGNKKDLITQLVVSTHSSHIAHELPFESLRYFRRLQAGTQVAVPTSTVINVGSAFGDVTTTQQFVTRYLRVQHADVFFADALILVEGTAERMLVPQFIKSQHETLHQAYVTMLEIGGSHAHRLRPLIDALKIPTLVITDLDPQLDGKSTSASRNAVQTTGNPTLKTWMGHDGGIDSLLDGSAASKELSGADPIFAVRFAYQMPLTATLHDKDPEEVIPTTFEDALALTNVAFFQGLEGRGLTRKFRNSLTSDTDLATAAKSLHGHLKSGSKAELALDVLLSPAFERIVLPTYIDEGLSWLEGRLKKPDALTLEDATHEG